jgi:tricorn protease
MSVSGGEPRQLTFETVAPTVRGWSPDGRVLYSSRSMEGATRVRELRLVDPQTLAVERIPLRYATTGSFSDDGNTLYFTRHGIATVNDSARLYRGGGMSQLWQFNLAGGREAERLAEDFAGPIEKPMFWNERIYFVSDQSGFDNIWSMNLRGRDIEQHSDFSDWRLSGASLHDGVVYYQRGADIYSFDLASERETAIAITLASDGDKRRERWIESPMDYLSDASLGGAGEQVALGARGRVVLVGNDARRRVELPIPADARARSAVLDAEGEWVYAIVDQGERGEIWRFAADGSIRAEQLTYDAVDHRWNLTLSPDGQWLIHHDKSARLYKLNLETLDNSLIQQNSSMNDEDFDGFSFSPDGRYMAFRTTGDRPVGSVIAVHDLQGGATSVITSDKYISGFPAFSDDGDWLYFLSQRNFSASPASPWGDRNMGVDFDKRTQLFALALQAGVTFPFAEPNELTLAQQAEESEADSDEGEADTVPMEVDWSASAQRLYQVPIPAGNYSGLKATADRLYLLESDGGPASLKSLAIEPEAELQQFAARVSSFELSNDNSRLFLRGSGSNPTLAIVPAGEKAPEDLGEYRLRTEGWRIAIDPAQEWEQLFLDGWRMHRDFAFDPDMRGVDWNGVRDRLLPLASRIGHRGDLADLFGQMASEIGILHSQVNGGDYPDDEESGDLASLGARYRPLDGGLEIIQIYQSEAERPESLGPLQQPGVDVREGDVITQVNNRPVTSLRELEQALMFQSGQQLLLQTSRNGESILNVVKPITAGAETMLRYDDWVGDNAAKVAAAGEGEIGYLHMRAMTGSDLASFARDFFPQNRMSGLIVDVRDNSGGNIDSIIINQFLRQAWAFWEFEPGGPTYPNMQETFRGHLAVLINAGTYSDGESFAAGIKALELGPLIGERTAGAGIWLSDRNRLADGGISRIAESPQYGLDGRWLIEGVGISPDIEVIAEPHALFNGEDQQLQAAIDYLQREIRRNPVPELRPQPLPPMGERGRDVRD